MKYLLFVCTLCLLAIKPKAQNVGIGTPAPQATLDVIRGTSANGTAMFRGTTHISFFNNGVFEDTYIRAGRDNGYVILNNIPGGRVGIGLAVPQQLLSVNGGMNLDQGDQNSGVMDNNVLRFGSNSGEAISSTRLTGGNNLFGLDFYTNSLKRISVTLGGNVGIGTTTPSEKLEVAGNILASAFKYATPKVHYYSIPCIEFASINSGYLVFNQIASGGAYISNAPGVGGLNAPLHLPHGAILLSLRFDFYDESTTQDIQGRLIAQPLDGYASFAGVQSSGSGGNSIQTSDFGPGGVTINNETTAYFVFISATSGAWNTADLRIKRVTAAYSLAEAQ
jgi:hypothetical protein